MTTISFRISDQLNKTLDNIAIKEERSKSSLIKKAIKTYLEDLYDYRLAEDGYKEYLTDGEVNYNMDEIKQKLGVE